MTDFCKTVPDWKSGFSDSKFVWEKLKNTGKPIVLYGMGDGADKILEVMDYYGIKAEGVFASDGFVRKKQFHGMTVKSYDEVCAEYDDFAAVICFSSPLEDVIANMYRIASERETYAPDVPVVTSGNPDGSSEPDILTPKMLDECSEDIKRVYGMLYDDDSKSLFRNVLEFRYTGKIELLKENYFTRADIWNILSPGRYKIAADLGAFNGDTAAEIVGKCGNLNKVIAFEPDERNYKKLCAAAEKEEMQGKIETVNAAAWNCRETLEFDSRGGRNSRYGKISDAAKIRYVSAEAPDSILCGYDFSDGYIKFDVEGAESRALDGCRNTIEKFSPDISLSVYHRTKDIWELPLKLMSMLEHEPDYRFFMRRPRCIPAWDLCLYAVKCR